MANFPDSIYTPASKSAGQVITAAFFNDPDGEITAIETGYINGTARMNSSNLNVTGTSTFANRPNMPGPIGAVRVFVKSTLTIGSSADSTLAYLDQALIQNSSLHSTTTNPERLIPQSTGTYQFDAQIETGSTAAGYRQILLEDSSGGIVGRSLVVASTAAGAIFQAGGFKRFDVTGGYVTVHFNSVGASTQSISTGNAASWFSMYQL